MGFGVCTRIRWEGLSVVSASYDKTFETFESNNQFALEVVMCRFHHHLVALFR